MVGRWKEDEVGDGRWWVVEGGFYIVSSIRTQAAVLYLQKVTETDTIQNRVRQSLAVVWHHTHIVVKC